MFSGRLRAKRIAGPRAAGIERIPCEGPNRKVTKPRKAQKLPPLASNLVGNLHPDLVKPFPALTERHLQIQECLHQAMKICNMIGRGLGEIKGFREPAKAKNQKLPLGWQILTEELYRLGDILHEAGKALPLGQHFMF